jgi:hypothetical protein
MIPKSAIALLFLVALAGCSSTSIELQPIPGSITYGGQPKSKLTKAPIGSRVPHEFRDEFGQKVRETYIIEPDRSLRLVNRVVEDPF